MRFVDARSLTSNIQIRFLTMGNLTHKVLSHRKLIFACIRVLIAILVVVGIIVAIQAAIEQLATSEIDWSETRPIWFFVSAISYLVGMCAPALFWHRILLATGENPGWIDSFRAFFISQLGKYVPGKALVVVLRTNEIRKCGTDATIAATSVFVETLTFMSVGACVGALVLAVAFRDQTWLIGIAIVIAVAASIPTIGPVFRKLVLLLRVDRVNQSIDEKLRRLGPAFMLQGWGILVLGWMLMAFSLYSVLLGLPKPRPEIADFPLVLACISLAIVTGFLSLLPGGIGVRELVIIPLLSPVVGTLSAVIAAVLLRLIWLIAEILIAGVFKFVHLSNLKQNPVLS